MHAVIDPFDPRYWIEDDHEYRIYGDDRCLVYAVVDQIDYEWAIQWRWCPKPSRPNKIYLRRAVGENANGQRLRTFTLYLHVEIMKRSGVEPPTLAHTLVDHRFGNSLDCRRHMLRWATPTMNARNVQGSHAYDLVEG